MASPGQLIGPFRLLSLLGKGAMGEVWRARDERLDRFVAIKLLPPGLAADEDRRARMLREAKAAAAVPHPNVVTLFDILSQDDRDFLVMELVEGRTLSDCVRKDGAFEPRRALDILIGIADAIAAAHGKGILHRDLKSANVMLTDAGVKVLDFGLAKLREAGQPGAADAPITLPPAAAVIAPADKSAAPPVARPAPATAPADLALDETMASVDFAGAASDLALDETLASTGDPAAGSRPGAGTASTDYYQTRAGTLLGTPMYMAPEQIGGEPPDERSEVFSVGVIAYELLAGKPPYRAKTLDELFAQITHEPPAPLPATVPTPLADLVLRALAKNPADRPATMAALRDEAVAAREALFSRRAARWPWLLAAAAAALVAAGGVYWAVRPTPAAPLRPGDKYVQQALAEYDVFYGDKALSSLRAATRHDPDHPLAHAYLILFGNADVTDRRAALTEAERILPALPERSKERALVQAAIALETAGPAAARRALLEARATGDRELDFWSAELAYRARDYDGADAGFRALLQVDDAHFRGRIFDHHSSVLLYLDRPDEALAVGRAYAEAFPGEADAVGVYATTLVAAGRFDEALRQAEEARRLNEGEDTLAGLAKVHAYRGELARARALYAESARRARPGRRVIRLAALGLLHLAEGDGDAARAAVAPCLPGGADGAVKERGACLWVAGLAEPERIPALLAELDGLAAAGTDLDPPYGFPSSLANLLRARQLFHGGGCVLPPEPAPAALSGQESGPSPEAAARARAQLEDARDFYAAYHVPFFNTYARCELAALARATGDPRAAAALLEATAESHPGRGPLLLELAHARAAFDPAAARATLDRLFREWPSLDPASRIHQRAAALRAALAR